ncbi:hypothetical protein SUGI_0786700 [Cryptomeria japonica]|uniref:RING-H2 finger protein ATL63 n=1 Tax=Cryptomeria japonica TaxID=3369 RepID=UPI0024147670|nr:RING-H2 finger protein ATL63 [Cryptomeria japonica]GLJ38584.1 hypothetical protein SUGI_0786700 [Cryptomeria japonica]
MEMHKLGMMAPHWSCRTREIISDNFHLLLFVMFVILIIFTLATLYSFFTFFWRLYYSDTRFNSPWISIISFPFPFEEEEEEEHAIDNGLDKQVIKALPVFVYKEEEESFKDSDEEEDEQPTCVICCSKFEQNEEVRELPKCNHRFHVNCIDKWFQLKSTCPICRINVKAAIYDEKAQRTEEEDNFSIVADDIVIDIRSLEEGIENPDGDLMLSDIR